MKQIRILLIPLMALALMGADFDASMPTVKVPTFDFRTERIPLPGQDAADEVIFSEGFEEGAEGWRTVDFTGTDTAWHKSDFREREEDGLHWWCGDTLEDYAGPPVGYDNRWLQWLDTPVLNLTDAGENLELTFDAWWLLEDPRIVPQWLGDYDAYDGWLVMISENGGDDFDALTPISPEYHAERIKGAGVFWDIGDLPGWFFMSIDGDFPDTNRAERREPEWLECSFDLSEYRAEDIVIRFLLIADSTVAAPYDNIYLQESGICIDNILISDGETDFLVNNVDDDPEPEGEDLRAGFLPRAEPSGDHWEITDEDGHESEHSAHCPIEASLFNGLITPPIEIPEEGWYTYFDYWLIANTVGFDPDADGALDDYFELLIRTESSGWQQILYDYGDPVNRSDWFENWAHYTPGTWFRDDLEEWRRMHNLSQFAGETVQLCWRVRTDGRMDDDQGTGIWIDDFRVMSTQALENDVGLDWLHIGYPVAENLNTECQVQVRNYGMITQNEIRKYYQIDDGRMAPIVPFGELGPDETEVFNFRLQRIPYAGMVVLRAYTALPDDDAPENDAIEVDLLIYPENMYRLGYDDRRATTYITFETGNPAVLFTPPDDGVPGAFDLQAIDVGWFDNDIEEEVNTTLRIFADNRGELGDELFSDEIRVISGVQRINLNEVDALKNLEIDFWVYFSIDRDDNLPWFDGRIISEDTPYWGAGHYYIDDGESVDERELEVQIQALITTDVSVEPDVVPSREEIDFKGVAVDDVKTIHLTVFGFGTSPVTIESIEIDNDQFFIFYDGEFPVTLALGDYTVFDVLFVPTSMDYVTATLTFNCNDESPPEVTLIGGVLAVGDEDTPSPFEFSLGEAYPNPFNSTTRFEYSLDMDGYISLSLYDLSGRKIMNFVEGRMSAGRHEAILEAGVLPTGIYLIKLETSNRTAVKKVALIR